MTASVALKSSDASCASTPTAWSISRQERGSSASGEAAQAADEAAGASEAKRRMSRSMPGDWGGGGTVLGCA